MSDAQPNNFPPAVPQSVVDHEARSRIGMLEADMRGLRNQVDVIHRSVESVKEAQSSTQSKLAAANTNLSWLRTFHEQQAAREKSNKPDPLSNNKVLLALIAVLMVLANVVEMVITHFVGG